MKSRIPFSFATVLIWIYIQIGPILSQNPVTGNFVRNYYFGDQLAYLGFASSKSIGIFHAKEPFTETGRAIYPSGFYQIVGQVHRILHVPLAESLNITSLALGLTFAFLLANCLQRSFKKNMASIALLTPLLLGTLNSILSGTWIHVERGHAVVWPLAASLYAPNAESIGLLIATIGILLMYLSPIKGQGTRQFFIAGAMFGVLANFHTYIFILGLTMVSIYLLAESLVRPSFASLRIRIGSITALLTAVVLFSNSGIVNVSSLTLLSILWICCFVFSITTITDNQLRKTLIKFVITIGLFALPQLVKIISATLANDPFIVARQQTSSGLSVSVFSLFLRNLPLLAILSFALFLVYKASDQRLFRLIMVLAITWLVLSMNHLWGLSQEPYRFAIAAQFPLHIVVVATYIQYFPNRSIRRSANLVGWASLLLVAIPSAADAIGFWNARATAGVLNFNSPYYQELRYVARKAPSGLIFPDSCIEPSILKVVSERPIASFSEGLAWPRNKELLQQILEDRSRKGLDLTLLSKAGIGSIIVDTACVDGWSIKYLDRPEVQRITQFNTRFQLLILNP